MPVGEGVVWMWLEIVLAATVAAPNGIVTMPESPPIHWLKRPTGRDFADVYPEFAQRRRMGGRVDLHCLVAPDGSMTDCQIADEAPAGMGFGAAALKLAQGFRRSPPDPSDASKPITQNIPIRFSMAGHPLPQANSDPAWIKQPTAEQVIAVWPAPAREKGVAGRAEIICVVTVEGKLEQCGVASETPSDMGFGAAALRLVPGCLFRAATLDGRPVPARVKIPIRFSRAPETSTPVAQ
jgi:TonB family protein